jgi:hypothetical protein
MTASPIAHISTYVFKFFLCSNDFKKQISMKSSTYLTINDQTRNCQIQGLSFYMVIEALKSVNE